MRYMRIVNEIKLSQVVGPKHKDSIEFVQKWKSGEKIPNPQFQKIKTDVSRAFDIATNSTKLKGANEFTVWGLQKQDGETEEYKYSFPNSVLHVAGYLKRTKKQLKRTIKSPNATKLVKAAMTACEPWVEIAEKLKAMKGDVVKRQVGVGTKKNPVPTGVLNKEIEEELEKIGKGFATELEENFEDHYNRGKPLPVVKPGTQTRRFTHIDDTINICYLAWKKNLCRHYSIANKKSYSILEVAKLFNSVRALLMFFNFTPLS